MAGTHRGSRFRRSDRHAGRSSGGGRFTAYGIILGLGILMAAATALDLPALGRATDPPRDFAAVPDLAISDLAVPDFHADLPLGPAAPPEEGGGSAASVDPVAEAAPIEGPAEPAEPEVAALPPAASPESPEPGPEPAAEEREPAIEERRVTVRRGDTLMKVLRRAGAGRGEAHASIAALGTVFNLRRLKIGQELTASFRRSAPADGADGTPGKAGELVSVTVKVDSERSVTASRTESGFDARETVRPLDSVLVRGAGRIDDSLFVSARRAGVPARVLMDVIHVFSWDVDFQRQIRRGDRFEILFERFRDDDGRPVKDGDVLFASLSLSGADLPLYRFVDGDGAADYYDPKGRSARKALMKTPVDGARLSSRYGKRRHPILGYTTMHRGVDFAAPRGTPVMAAGDGVVERASRYGAYGNYVRIRHNRAYKTVYAHLKSYARGVRPGKRVRQGQTIGYVGSTGRSTGPHLHYEVHRNGKQINPLRLKLPTGKVLKGRDLARFLDRKATIDVALAETPALSRLARAGAGEE